MKTLVAALALGCLPVLGYPQTNPLSLLPSLQAHAVFGGGPRTIPMTWLFVGAKPFSQILRLRAFLLGDSIALPAINAPWKRLEVLPGQTVMETARVNFPEVRAATPFLIQWIGDNNTVLGTTPVIVYPTNLLAELKPLTAETPIGLLDPENTLKPLLKSAGVEYADLEETALDSPPGKLAIAGPFSDWTRMPPDLGRRLEALAKRGIGVVWLLPPPALLRPGERPREPASPTFYALPHNRAALVIAQASMTTNIAENPLAQLNLIQLSKQALNPEPPKRPFLEP